MDSINMKTLALITILSVFSMGLTSMAQANSKESYYTNQMANYATIIGRATACGSDPTKELKKVGVWMDQWFDELNLSQKMRATYLNIFMEGTKHHLLQQKSGNSPDTCKSVQKAFRSL
jgi:hypothetical protein